MNTFDDTARRRIRFLTRRGLLELDLMLGRFMQQSYDSLNDEELHLFVGLLDLPDQQFLAVLNGKESSPNPAWQPIIDQIRQAARIV